MAEKPCLYKCGEDGTGRKTNNHDGICVGCAMDIHMDGHPRHMTPDEFTNFKKEEGDNMKICPKCGTGTGPRAKACLKCGETFEAKEKKAGVGASGSSPKEKPQGSSDAARPDRRKNVTKVKDEASQASPGAIRTAEKKIGGGGDFKVLVDLSPYPRLYGLISQSHFFEPGDLLLLLIKDRLAAAEADNVKAL